MKKTNVKKTTQLKALINSKSLNFIMEAHNALSAKIVQEAGFPGIWASGLTMSSSLGVRDNNEASWTQILEICEFMADATSIPILVDGDTGFGNFNNARRFVNKLIARGIAGVCIEDKIFPKTNSFISGEEQDLADIAEYCGKIKAIQDNKTDNDFVVVARTEAFITGHACDEALMRAKAYQQAGADAVLIHSKKTTSEDIDNFMAQWDRSCPVIIVPTSYHATPTAHFEKLQINLIIWANHTLRSAITAMQNITNHIYKTQEISSSINSIVSMAEIFRLQNVAELQLAEKKYLPNGE